MQHKANKNCRDCESEKIVKKLNFFTRSCPRSPPETSMKELDELIDAYQGWKARAERLEAENEMLTQSAKIFQTDFLKQKAKAERLEDELNRACVWDYQEYSCHYETGCDNAWCFETGDREENGCVYCPYCGGKIVELKKEAQGDE